jgi:hypothetical protein
MDNHDHIGCDPQQHYCIRRIVRLNRCRGATELQRQPRIIRIISKNGWQLK